MSFLDIHRGDSPLILGLPHTGTDVPEDIARHLNDTGKALADTDWRIHELYADLVPDVTTVRTPIHRYVIDVNRDPDGVSLYPGQNTTGLCPVTDFDGRDIYLPGKAPQPDEVVERRKRYHAPYHAALASELDRVHARHGFAVLYDCHSIRSRVPFLFDGLLPDFNIGTNNGTTCDAAIERSVVDICAAAQGYTSILNGRFKGGWTTRYYGRPDRDIHAIQMELAQSTYLRVEEPPWELDPDRSARLRVVLEAVLNALLEWRPR